MRIVIEAPLQAEAVRMEFAGTVIEVSGLSGRLVIEDTGSGASVCGEAKGTAELLDTAAYIDAPCSVPAADAQPPRRERDTDEGLFLELSKLRTRIADEEGSKPFMVFHDETLREISIRRPATISELLTVKGIGAAKADKYGDALIALVRRRGTADSL